MNKRLKYLILVFALLGVVIASVAEAQEDNPPSSSDTTSASYQENLRQWQSMTEEQREAIRQKVYAMDEKQRQTVIENALKFKQLPKEDQDRIRNNYRKFQELSHEKKELLRQEHHRFEGISSKEKSQLRRDVIKRIEHKEVLREHRNIQSPKEVSEHRQQRNNNPALRQTSALGPNGQNHVVPHGELKARADRNQGNHPPILHGGPGMNGGNPHGPQGGSGTAGQRRPEIEQGSNTQQSESDNAQVGDQGGGPGGGGPGGGGPGGGGPDGGGPGGGGPGGGHGGGGPGGGGPGGGGPGGNRNH